MDGLGLVGDVIHGREAACDWIERRFELGYSVTIWLRTLEDVGNDRVLGVGTVSETGRMGNGYAATVAWVWQVRDDRICSVFGYPSEAEARRSLTLSG